MEGKLGWPTDEYVSTFTTQVSLQKGRIKADGTVTEHCYLNSSLKEVGGLNNVFNTTLEEGTRPNRLAVVGFDESNNPIEDNLQYGSYNNTSNVWIITHGMNGYAAFHDKGIDTDFVRIAREVKKNYPNDYVLLLDWGGAKDAIALFPTDLRPDLTDQWIRPTAEDVVKKLEEWGFDKSNGDRVNFIGHSMGTIMVSEISRLMGSRSELILLEPPRFVGTALDGHIIDERDERRVVFNSFQGVGRFSRAFVGAKSNAADFGLAATADETIEINYIENIEGPITGFGEEHGWVNKSFIGMTSDQIFVDGILNIHDRSKRNEFKENWNQDKFEATIWSEQPTNDYDPAHIQNLMFKQSQDENTFEYRGTNGNNLMTGRVDRFKEHKMYSGEGSDTFSQTTGPLIYKPQIEDFDITSDQIKIYGSYRDDLEIREENDTIILYHSTLGTDQIWVNNLSLEEREKLIVDFDVFKITYSSENFTIN